MTEVDVIEDPAAAVVALDPVRARLLAELAEPRSAAMLATRVGLPRQKVNYHLRALEAHGLVRVAEERRWGGLTERLLVASAASYLVSPQALGPAAPRAASDEALSAGYVLALAARVVREVGAAQRTSAPLETLGLDTELRFADAEARAAFARDLASAVTALASRYHDPDGDEAHRLVVAVHPIPEEAP